MHCTNSSNSTDATSGAQPAKRLPALFLCALLAATLIFSSAFLLAHAGHEHDHSGANGACTTCAHITAAQKLFEQLTAAATATFALAGGLFGAAQLLRFAPQRVASLSLVQLKIRLNI